MGCDKEGWNVGCWDHLLALRAYAGRCEALSYIHLEIREVPTEDRPVWRGQQRKMEKAWVLEHSAEPLNQLQGHIASHLSLCMRINFPHHEAILK